MKNYKSNTGFTLIEMLIVIALLGILAVGLLAAVDPLEQFRKGQDTAQRNGVQELYNAYVRYYTMYQQFPMGISQTFAVTSLNTATMTSEISSLVSSGELKSNYLGNVKRQERIFVWYRDTGNVAEHSVCFLPQSKSVRMDPNTVFTVTGTTLGTCTAHSLTSTNCYWCVR
jgi:prepilin-type N-terminal cleavage/methylation domain-containing protein